MLSIQKTSYWSIIYWMVSSSHQMWRRIPISLPYNCIYLQYSNDTSFFICLFLDSLICFSVLFFFFCTVPLHLFSIYIIIMHGMFFITFHFFKYVFFLSFCSYGCIYTKAHVRIISSSFTKILVEFLIELAWVYRSNSENFKCLHI